jgi:hypothetical protein
MNDINVSIEEDCTAALLHLASLTEAVSRLRTHAVRSHGGIPSALKYRSQLMAAGHDLDRVRQLICGIVILLRDAEEGPL